MKKYLLFLAFCAAAIVTAQQQMNLNLHKAPPPNGLGATKFYVDVSGSDANNGKSLGTAWQHPHYAVTNSTFLGAIATTNVDVILTSGEVFPETNFIITNLNPSPYFLAIVASGTSPAIFSNWNNSASSILGTGGAVMVVDSSYIYFTNITAVGSKSFVTDGADNEEGFWVQASSKLTHDIGFVNCNSYWHENSGFELAGDFQPSVTAHTSNVWCVGCSSWSNAIEGFKYDNWNGSPSDLCNLRIGMTNCVATNIPGSGNVTAWGIYISNATNGYVWNCLAANGGNATGSDGEYSGDALILYYCNNVQAEWGEYYGWSNNNVASVFIGECGNGCDIDYQCINCSMQHLYSHNNQGTGFIEYSGLGSNLFRYNVSISNSTALVAAGLGPTEFGVTPNAGITATNVAIYNNAFIAAIAGIAAVSNVSSSGSWMSNNILWCSHFSPSMTLGGSTWKMGHNDYYESGGGAFPVNVNGTAYASVPAWGGDANALTANPFWLNGLVAPTLYPSSPTTSTNWILKASSSTLINAGILIANNGGLDFLSNTVSSVSAPDIGPVQKSQ